jgi:sugar lactone lactonase YvrE
MQPQAELVVDARHATGESPVWHVGEQAVYGVDIPARQMWRWQFGQGSSQRMTSTWQTPEMIGCIAPCAHPGRWVAGLESGIFELQLDGEALQSRCLAAVDHAVSGMRFNDGRCDRQGRFWAGTMLMNMSLASPVGALYRYDATGLDKIIDGLITPNGLGFSPDGRTMYLSDSHPLVQTIWAFDYDVENGVPSNRRVFVDMNEFPGRPDGAAVDADGCYWICANDAGLIHRFTPDGKLDQSLAVPVKKPAMCAFGGAALDTLFVTSIRPEGVDLSDQPLAGAVFALRPGVRGLPEPVFFVPS